MKKILIIAAMLLTAVAASAQGGESIYNKYTGKDGVQGYYISPMMYGLSPCLTVEDYDFAPALSSFNGMCYLKCENSNANAIAKDVYGMVKSENYSLFFEASADDYVAGVYAIASEGVVSDFVFIKTQSDSVTFYAFSGELQLSALASFVETL